MKYLICAGGTGGHIYPAITLANKLKELGHEITFIGSNQRMEKTLVPKYDFEFIGLDINNYNGIKGKLLGPISLIKNYIKANKIVRDYDVVIGFGNYVSLPVMYAAFHSKKKTVIHEQNSFPGKANMAIEKKCDLVIGSMEENLKYFKNPNTFILGNPQSSTIKVIKDSAYLKSLGLDPAKKTVLIFFGSLGSMTLNETMKDIFKKYDFDFQILYAAGSSYISEYKNFEKENVKVMERVEGYKAMAESDLLISRAGASTIAEITSIGIPAILVPSPYVANNHQYYNALTLKNINAAEIILEKDLSADVLYNNICAFVNDSAKLEEMKNNALKLSNTDALDKIAEKILEL